ISCASLLIYSHVNCAAMLVNQPFSTKLAKGQRIPEGGVPGLYYHNSVIIKFCQVLELEAE
ncbi:hypothetical protein, partial [Legionella sp. 29fVS95]|uniref:hypothetical protein n=1 Tax=Legionella sp. 29fVS95 TaxID=3402813 RepID=UPI003AF6F1B0